jgi:hypothetical protein
MPRPWAASPVPPSSNSKRPPRPRPLALLYIIKPNNRETRRTIFSALSFFFAGALHDANRAECTLPRLKERVG